MNFSAPKKITWWIAVVVGVVGILATFVSVPVLSGFAFWLVVIGFALLAVATVVEGL
jgi:heme/copper-type cytochrome/quinol oxidase subunit 1